MMSDIVERLRNAWLVGVTPKLLHEAADEIERLRAENARLVGILDFCAAAQGTTSEQARDK